MRAACALKVWLNTTPLPPAIALSGRFLKPAKESLEGLIGNGLFARWWVGFKAFSINMETKPSGLSAPASLLPRNFMRWANSPAWDLGQKILTGTRRFAWPARFRGINVLLEATARRVPTKI